MKHINEEKMDHHWKYQIEQLMRENFLNVFYMMLLKNVVNVLNVDRVMSMYSVDLLLDHRLMMQENVQMMLMDDFVRINNDNQSPVVAVVVVDQYFHLMMRRQNNHVRLLNLHLHEIYFLLAM
jgi:hypothetical protein